MNRAILVALGTGMAISSAAALDIAGAVQSAQPTAVRGDLVHASRMREAARAGQRDRIQARYLEEREQCAALGGLPREQCLVSAHARKGRALLEAAAPYETRS